MKNSVLLVKANRRQLKIFMWKQKEEAVCDTEGNINKVWDRAENVI